LRGRIRVFLCVAAAVALVAQLGPIAQAQGETEAHLASDITSETPANGESLELDKVSPFDPAGGRAVIEPDTENQEEITYSGVDAEALLLLDVERLEPAAHPQGSEVSPLPSSSASPEPSPSPQITSTSSPTTDAPSPPPEQTDGGDEGSQGGSAEAAQDGASENEPTSDDNSEAPAAEVTTCDVVRGLTGIDVCGLLDVRELCEIHPDFCDVGLLDPLPLLCQVSGLFCSVPDPVTRVAFDNGIGIPSTTPSEPGCGLAGFTAYKASGQRASGRAYTATATTVATASVPKTYSGTLDGSGRAVLSYCPPNGIVTAPVEVTFTATVDGVTATATRSWTPRTPEVIARVQFDDTLIAASHAPGCGLVGFTAKTVTGASASQNQPYTATATTAPSLAAPRTYSGTLDDSGRAVLSYCPAPGIVADPLEVTFTATVGGVTETAVRTWTPDAALDRRCPCVYLWTVTTEQKDAEGNTVAQQVFKDVTDVTNLRIPAPHSRARCARNTYTVEAKSAFFSSTLYKWTQVDDWCWDPSFYSENGRAWHGRFIRDRLNIYTFPSNVAWNWSYNGEVAADDQYNHGEVPCEGPPATHCLMSMRMGHFSSPLWIYTANQYPCITTTMTSDGKWWVRDAEPLLDEVADGDCHYGWP
jgi:hypothetical protein